MCEAKWLFKVFVIGLIVKGCHLISTRSSNGTAEILWNLSGRALRGETFARQYGYPPPYPVHNPYRPPPLGNQQNYPNNFMSALDAIARNDDLQCVPKLLCELTSGSRTVTGKQATFLPFDVNMESLLGLLSSFSGTTSSPLLLFGRAALLGYSAKGNSASCSYSFPRCPNDPDQLVRYLNNYNGGFFRYFNGAPQRQTHVPGYHQGHGYRAEQRIQTMKLSQLVPATSYNVYTGGNRLKSEIKFPSDDSASNEIIDAFQGYKSQKTLTFPEDETFAFGQYFRKPKMLSFPAVNAINNVFQFERPLPNHIASPVIFPTRTGTGELILDTDEFDLDYDYNQRPNHVAFI